MHEALWLVSVTADFPGVHMRALEWTCGNCCVYNDVQKYVAVDREWQWTQVRVGGVQRGR